MKKNTKFIALVGTKGGILKSTLVQCLSTSKVFENYNVAILEADVQSSLKDWIKERDNDAPKMRINLLFLNSGKDLKEKIEEINGKYDFVFLDLPGESLALNLTRTAMAYSDLCIFPVRTYHKDISAFDSQMRPVIKDILQYRNKKHFVILPTFAHHNTATEKYRSYFSDITEIDVLKNVHVDRQVYTYFSINGLTLREYMMLSVKDKIEQQKAKKAVEEMERIAQEVYNYINI